MALSDDLERIAAAAASFASEGERVSGVVAAEPLGFGRIYPCTSEHGEARAWLALDDEGKPVESRQAVREAASLAALCELAEERAGGGDLTELQARLAELRATERPAGIEEAEAAAAALALAIEEQPRAATPAHLDEIGAASRRLEQALGDDAGSPFAAAMQQAIGVVDELAAEVERTYKGPLA
jgi:hypothetical protein